MIEGKPTVAEALAGAFEKSTPRLAVWGDLFWTPQGQPDGAGVAFSYNDHPEPPIQEYVPP